MPSVSGNIGTVVATGREFNSIPNIACRGESSYPTL